MATTLLAVDADGHDSRRRPSQAELETMRKNIQIKSTEFRQISYDPSSKAHICGGKVTETYTLSNRTFTIGPYDMEFTLFPTEGNEWTVQITKSPLDEVWTDLAKHRKN